MLKSDNFFSLNIKTFMKIVNFEVIIKVLQSIINNNKRLINKHTNENRSVKS